MKFILSISIMTIMFLGCQPKQDNSAQEAFEKNSQTVLANIQGFEDENVDYSVFADDYVMMDTGVGSKDSLSLDDVMKNDKSMFENYDFKLLTDPLVLLPGVDPQTKKPDGSVRYYGKWQITIPATDSTEAISDVLKYYESIDFNEEGKILFQQGYGDFSGLFKDLQYESNKETTTAE